ncbi:BrnT family toxin [Enterovirga aerilata]|uniref:BrnT family toxin n=1 Tax=Enterovirga aerilata TaxID=2730920 RepID=A0A849IGE9_9HYPH|nr:BrnT family toxin [Enterovirga sp. DB1703]
MAISFDPAKSERNREERGLPFEVAELFEFETAIVRQDVRLEYGEPRYQALGRLGEMICFLVFTPTSDGFRVISLRKASRRERKTWLASRTPD